MSIGIDLNSFERKKNSVVGFSDRRVFGLQGVRALGLSGFGFSLGFPRRQAQEAQDALGEQIVAL